MTLEITNNGNDSNIVVSGVIRSVEDSTQLNEAIESVSTPSLQIVILDSFSMTSTVIGTLLKCTHAKKINLNIKVHNARLFTLFDNLNLVGELNIKKV
jgi:hypothetical protein